MRVLIFTSSAGTAHDVAAYALKDWFQQLMPEAEVRVDQVLENASWFTRSCTSFYNWIQKKAPWLHQIYWRIVELEDLIKPGTVLLGRRYLVRLLRSFQPDLLISTYPHTNRGHFDLAKRVVGPRLRCITCCTEIGGGFGFSRNWVSGRSDLFWTLTHSVDQELRRRRFPTERVRCLGPLHPPAFHHSPAPVLLPPGLPLLVLSTGANGANNHRHLLEQLLPFAARIRVIALCGKSVAAMQAVQAWIAAHPQLAVETRGFLGPEAMADLYRQAWALVGRPGARTATEALSMGCPLIFNHYGLTMPQELLAPRHFRRLGLEVSIRRPGQLAAVIQRWLNDPGSYQALRQGYARHRLESDPQAILQQLVHG